MAIYPYARTVVTGKDDQCVVRQSESLQRFQYLLYTPVSQYDLVATGAGLTLARYELRRLPGGMRH